MNTDKYPENKNASIVITEVTEDNDLPTIFAPSGVYEQNECGIIDPFDENKVILAPYNIRSSISKRNVLTIHISTISEDGKLLFINNYRSKIEEWNTLPSAILQACSGVENVEKHRRFLTELILSNTGLTLFHDTLVDPARCHEMTHALYTLNEMKEFADHIQYIRANPEHWTPGTPI